jgi:hypothetical protein
MLYQDKGCRRCGYWAPDTALGYTLYVNATVAERFHVICDDNTVVQARPRYEIMYLVHWTATICAVNISIAERPVPEHTLSYSLLAT